MTRPDLHKELADAGAATTLLHFRHLVALGVPRATLAAQRVDSWGWGVVNAIDVDDGLYAPGDGPLHLVLPVWDGHDLIDLVAFRSGNPTGWRLRNGHGLALGLERGLERHHWEEEVELTTTPLDWLRNGADGLCIVDWDAPELHMLATLPRIVCPDQQCATQLRRALIRPQHLPQISIKETRLAA